MTEPTRSPIKDKPLRLPNQSLMEERDALWDDKLEPWALLAVFFLVLAGREWFRYFRPMQPHPILVSAVALAALGLAVWRLHGLRPPMRALRQGIEGEKAVGQFLERLREQGSQDFHDLIGEGFNIDHVLIGPAGVFTVESRRAPAAASRCSRWSSSPDGSSRPHRECGEPYG
jgi:Nuclease-related domain